MPFVGRTPSDVIIKKLEVAQALTERHLGSSAHLSSYTDDLGLFIKPSVKQ